ncbi:MAG: translation initiation factor IF-3 [Acidobacteria bacterium]|nr:translation initiation factor IF-3 [Acidobacteriota bacterium]
MARRFGGNRFKPRFREPQHRTNERIRVPSVRVVLEDGGTLGIMDTRDAIQEARNRGLDLVEIASNAKPPVCKIIDYGKFLYEQKKKAHEAKKKQVTVQVKEIKFRPGTDDHDYEYRRDNAKRWLSEGDKVRAAIAFRGREMTHRELGAKILARLTEELAEFGDVEVAPKMEGYQMFTILSPKKSKAVLSKHTSVAPNKAEEPEKPKRAAKPAAAKAEKPKTEDGEDEIF